MVDKVAGKYFGKFVVWLYMYVVSDSCLVSLAILFESVLTLSLMAPCAHFISWPRADLPHKNRADPPKGRELRATALAALSLMVS